MGTYNIKQIETDLNLAREAANEADPGPKNDGGSCNLDSCRIHLPYFRKQKALKIGLRPHHRTSWFTLPIGNGQANRNTVMNEAASKKLEELGYRTTIDYIID